MYKLHTSAQRGYTLLLVLVFGAVFLMVVSALTGRVLVEQRAELARVAKSQARSIAEAGLEYYKWFLAHNPGDIQNGTGLPGPYQVPYSDPETGTVGTYSLNVTGNTQCGILTSIDVTSTGWTDAQPQVTSTVTGKYAQPSVASFAYIINDNVHVASDRQIQGPYHANGGINFDGTSNSQVTSAVSNWLCTSLYGCNPASTTPGIFGTGGDSSLWSFPSAQFDFAGITQNFSTLRTLAQNSGLYFAPYGGAYTQGRGYKLRFNSNRTVDVYQVRSSYYLTSFHIDGTNWTRDYFVPRRTRYIGNFQIPADCGLIFVEDQTWVSGTISGKITLVTADVDIVGYKPSVILEDDLKYTTSLGGDGLSIVSEGNIVVSPVSPNSLQLNGIFVAQGGYFGRNLYPCWYWPYDQRSTLDIQGTIVSNKSVSTKWGYSYYFCQNTWSGYNNRTNSYDRKLSTDPPPFTPVSSPEYRYVEWREQ